MNEGTNVRFRVKNPHTLEMELEKTQAVGRGAGCAYRTLPAEDGRIASEASCALDTDDFLSGTLKLRPGASKDLEGVHECTQVFYVTKAQDQSLELQVGKNPMEGNLPFLLSKGDHFYIHANNCYSLYNHSRSKMAEAHFVVLKPRGEFE